MQTEEGKGAGCMRPDSLWWQRSKENAAAADESTRLKSVFAGDLKGLSVSPSQTQTPHDEVPITTKLTMFVSRHLQCQFGTFTDKKVSSLTVATGDLYFSSLSPLACHAFC